MAALTVLASAGFLYFGMQRYVNSVRQIYPLNVIDDAFITYRYAENWAAGIGPTWNAGEPPIEGYSCPLYVAVLAAAKFLYNVDVPEFSKMVCLAAGIGTLALLFLLGWTATGQLLWASFITGVMAANPCFAVWSAGGMETMLYTFLVTLSALAVLAVRRKNTLPAWLFLGVSLALLSETRSEGPIFTLAVGLCAIFGKDEHWPWGRTVVCLLAVGALLGIHTLVRLHYYGALFPLPFFAKKVPFRGEDLVRDFLQRYAPYFGVALLALLKVKRAEVKCVLRHTMVAIALLLLVILNVDPVMAQHQRYFLPILPLLYLAAGLGLAEIGAAAGSTLVPFALVVIIALAIESPSRVGASLAATLGQVRTNSELLDRCHIMLGRWLAENVADRTTLAAASDCGAIPFYSRLRFIDMAGLNDAHLARLPNDAGYVLGRDPGLIVFSGGMRGMDEALRQMPLFTAKYEEVIVTPSFRDVHLYRRKDLPRFRGEPIVEAEPAEQPCLVEGFDVVLSSSDQGAYPGHRGDSSVSYWANYRPAAPQSVSWRTAVSPCTGPIELVFTSSLSEDPGTAELSVDGRPLLQFDIGAIDRSLKWSGQGATLRFVPRGLAMGIAGYFRLRLPEGMVPQGTAATLTVTPVGGTDRTWFLLKGYRDTISYEHLGPALGVGQRGGR